MPERRPKERSESRRGELFPGPEWTNLTGGGGGGGRWEWRGPLRSNRTANGILVCKRVRLRSKRPDMESSGEIESREKRDS